MRQISIGRTKLGGRISQQYLASALLARLSDTSSKPALSLPRRRLPVGIHAFHTTAPVNYENIQEVSQQDLILGFCLEMR